MVLVSVGILSSISFSKTKYSWQFILSNQPSIQPSSIHPYPKDTEQKSLVIKSTPSIREVDERVVFNNRDNKRLLFVLATFGTLTEKRTLKQ